jgi:hypothetical protein
MAAEQERRPGILGPRVEIARRALALEVRRGEVAMARGALIHVAGVLAGVLAVAADGTWRAVPAAALFVLASFFGARATTSTVTVSGLAPEALERFAVQSADEVADVLGQELGTLAEELRSRRAANRIRVTRSRLATWALTAGAVLAMLPVVV